MGPGSDPRPPAESKARLPAAALPFLWGLLVFLKYFFWNSHPVFRALPALGGIFDFRSFPAVPAGRALPEIGVSLRIFFTAFLVSATAWALGRRVRKWLSLDLGDPWVRFAFDFGFGVSVLDLFWVGTGLVRLWYPPLWTAAACLGVSLLVWDSAVLLRRPPPGPRFFSRPKETAFLCLSLAGALYWAFSILLDLAPETFYDSMVYHLAVPRYWLFHHGLRDFSTNLFSNFPYAGELFFMNGLVFQGTEAAKMLHAVSFGVCALLAGGWARELGGERAGWLALGLTLTLPVFALATWATAVEGFLALGLLLFTYALNRFASRAQFSWALAAGLFAGLAFSTKYTAFLGIAVVLLVTAFQKREAFLGKRRKFLPAALGGALLLAGPWALKNMADTGNPFFPYFMSLFPGRHLTGAGYETLLREQHGWVAHTFAAWLQLPWTLTLANQDSYNFCGPMALAAFPFLFLFNIRHPSLRRLAAILPLFFALSLAVTHILKFMILGFVLLYILIGAVLGGGDRPGWGKAAAWAAVFSAFFCSAYLAEIENDYYPCAGIWAGRQSRADYLTGPGQITPYYAMAQWINANLPKDSRLLIVGDARGLYYDRPFLTNTVFDGQVLAGLAREEKDAEGIAHRLREMGVDDLAVNGLEGIRVSSQYHHYDLTVEQWARLDDFIQRDTALVYQSGLQGVYRILPEFQAKAETQDLVLFFSKSASRFVLDVQKRLWREAGDDIQAVVRLYPFSRFWMKQKEQFGK